MHELGLLDEFLKLPHQQVRQLTGQVGRFPVVIADFSHLPTRCKFIAFMPQWDFLNFLAARAARYPGFHLRLSTEATDLIEQSDRVVGVRAIGPEGPIEVSAALVVGADGRGSIVRERAGLRVRELGAPIDVLWFRLSRRATDPAQTMGRFDVGRIFIAINRGEHWQCGYVIPKGALEAIRARGLGPFRAAVAALAPYLADRVDEISACDDVKLLTVQVDRLDRWYRRACSALVIRRMRCPRWAAWDQSRRPGCGGHRQSPRGASSRGKDHRRAPSPGAAAARATHPPHPEVSGPDPEPGDHSSSGDLR